ncbi:pleiotropic drug resistance 12 [Perilla frutescens var. frutescens]|nr:pleiotropic drug resistance 12 [Perilla frutescens var. frutescens]
MEITNSFRRSTRSNGQERFSHSSSRDEDDEEALKWAAIEKLPTFDRLRRGILVGSRGESNEVDVTDLGYEEKKKLVDRLVKFAEDDNEKFLLKVKNRIDRVGIDLPTIEVRFEDIKIEAEGYVGSRALPTFLNFYINIMEQKEVINNPRQHQWNLKA